MNEIITTSGYTNPIVEKSIRTLQKDLTIMSLYGKQDSAQNKPTHIEYWRSRMFNPTLLLGQEVFNYLQQVEQPLTTANRKNEIAVAAKQQTDLLTADINYEEIKLHKVQDETKQLKLNRIKDMLANLVLLFLVIAGLSDAYVTMDAFLSGGLSFFAALCYALPTGIAVGLGASFAAAKYRDTKKKHSRAVILAVTFISAGVFFSVLGFMRSNFYNSRPNIAVTAASEITAEPAASITGWELAIASFLLFAAGFFFCVMVAKTEKEQSAANELRRLGKEKEAMLATIAKKEREIEVIKKAAVEEIALCAARCEYAMATVKRIITIIKGALAEYAALNIALRTDGQVPPYLTDIPDIQFK